MKNKLKYKCCLCGKGICKYKADLNGQAIWVDSICDINKDERVICFECAKSIVE